jgi:hypothetical protein
MSTSNPTINLDGKQLISIALLMATILSIMSIVMGGFSVVAQEVKDDLIGQYAVGGIVLPVESVATPAISMVFLLIIMGVAAVALTAVVFKGQK